MVISIDDKSQLCMYKNKNKARVKNKIVKNGNELTNPTARAKDKIANKS